MIMASIQKRVGKKGITYRVEHMSNGHRTSKTFKELKLAEAYSSMIDQCASGDTIQLKELITERMKTYNGRNTNSVMSICSFWIREIGNEWVHLLLHKDVEFVLLRKQSIDGCSDETLKRYRSVLSMCFEASQKYSGYNPCRNVSYKKSAKNKSWFTNHLFQ